MTGKFIVFEGGEGSGKTSNSKWVVEQLKASGEKVYWTREPGGSPYAESIRDLILNHKDAANADAETMFALFWAARRDHLVTTVLPLLESGTHVICDRFDASTWAYQIWGQRQEQLINLFWQMRKQYIGTLMPYYLFFHIDPILGLPRAKGRVEQTTHFDERDLEFHGRVLQGFIEFFVQLSSPGLQRRFASIDASMPLAQVQQEALLAVRRMLGS